MPGLTGTTGGDRPCKCRRSRSGRHRPPTRGRCGHPELRCQPGGGSQAGDDARIRVEEGPEELVAAACGTDQVEVVDHLQSGMAARFAFTDRGGLLDHRPDRGDQVEVAGPAIVSLEAPRNQRGLIDRPASPIRERRRASISETSRGMGDDAGGPC